MVNGIEADKRRVRVTHPDFNGYTGWVTKEQSASIKPGGKDLLIFFDEQYARIWRSRWFHESDVQDE